ncbi:MAG: hypothetical protein Kow0029_17050 [Candidatus Rifleibacteriota bacterium]
MNKRVSIGLFALVITITSIVWANSTNPFTENEITVSSDSNGNEVRLQTGPDTTRISADKLKEAFAKLAEAQQNFAELLRQFSSNPMKFMQNGSLDQMYKKIADIQKRLSALAERLLELSKNSGIDIATIPTVTDKNSSTSTTTGTSGNPPPLTRASSNGQITSRSPQFAQWFANGLRIAQGWNFPDVTNIYGEKVKRADFIRAIIFIESSGIHKRSNGQIVTSSCGALGFMQLMQATARGLGVNPRDPGQNIQGGCKYFNTIFNRGTVGRKSGVEKIVMAGCAYNMGPYSKKLKQSWSSFLASSNVSKGPKCYGLKVKMCLGLQLSAAEKSFVQQHMSRGQSVDSYARSLYSAAHGIGR